MKEIKPTLNNIVKHLVLMGMMFKRKGLNRGEQASLLLDTISGESRYNPSAHDITLGHFELILDIINVGGE